MSKKFYVGICCLALLATSVASGYGENFEGYTGNVGDAWDGTPEFPASGWGDLYRGPETWSSASHALSGGYNTTQGVAVPTDAEDQGAARLITPQGPNSTFVLTAMVDFPGRDMGLFVGADELAAGPQDHFDGFVWAYCNSDEVMIQYAVNTSSRSNTGWITAVDWSTVGWVEHKIEMDTNENARPTTVRYYYRDLEDDGSGPVGAGTWNQIDLGDAGGGVDLDMGGDDWQIEAIGFCARANPAETASAYFDNFNATPEPVTLAILGAGGLLALFRRRR